MAHIENCESEDLFKSELKNMADSQILAQEIVQKGAIHALQYLMVHGCTPDRCVAMIENAKELAEHIQAECRQRGLPIVDLSGKSAPDAAH